MYSIQKIPSENKILGQLPNIKKDPANFFLNLSKNHSEDMICFKIALTKMTFLNNPDLIEQVFGNRHKEFKKSSNYERFEEALGKSILLMSSTKKWAKHRQIIQPSFDRKIIENQYSNITYSIISDFIKTTKKNESVNAIDVYDEMSVITIKVIIKSMFNQSIDDKVISKLDKSVNHLLKYVGMQRVFPKINTQVIFHPIMYLKAKKCINYIDKIIYDLIDKQEKYPDNESNLLNSLVAHKSIDSSITYKDIRNEILTMIFAGYETTSVVLQWALYALSKNTESIEKIYNEVKDINYSDDGEYFKKLDNLEYLDCVIKETMRMYPSFWGLTRVSLKDKTIIGGKEVSKKEIIAVSQYAMQNSPKYWKDPEKFQPERFLDENCKKIRNGLYFPFGFGARKCIGYRFAEMEAKIVLAEILRKYIPVLCNEPEKGFKPLITLRPKENILMKLIPR